MTSIADTLRADPLCLRIVHFLLEHETAMDTARGIAAWWVYCDEIAAQTALDCLIACGAITAYTFRSGTLYGLTRNPEVRAELRAMEIPGPSLGRPSPPVANGNHS